MAKGNVQQKIHFNKTLIYHKHDEHNLPLKISHDFVKVMQRMNLKTNARHLSKFRSEVPNFVNVVGIYGNTSMRNN